MAVVFYFLQYLFAVLLLFVILPRALFTKAGGTFSDVFFANFTRMMLTIIVIGYVLVIAKLFEFISIFAIFIALILRKLYFSKPQTIRNRKMKDIKSWLTDYFEGIVDLPAIVSKKIRNKFVKNDADKHRKVFDVLFIAIAVLTIFYALFIRIYDAFANTAPAMSDAYVTLAWAKYISNSILFYDGIYPQGFHITQAFIQKFSSIDMLYVLKFTGPMSSFLITYGMYFSVSRLLKCKYSGFIAAAAYGLFGAFFTGSLDRQTATNSQEFAFLFIMPCLYFFYKYAKSKLKVDLYVAGSTLAVIGLVHTLAFAYTALSIGVLGLSFLLVDRPSFKAVFWKLFRVGLLSGIASIVPVGIGLLLGHDFHGASIEFIQETDFVAVFPTLISSDYLSGIAALLCLLLFFVRRKDENATAYLFLVLLWGMSFVLYYFGGHISGSLIVETRARELFAIASPVMLGAGFYSLFGLVRKLDFREMVRPALASLCVLIFFVLNIPAPIIPYKMEYDSPVEQYLRISKEYRPTEWLIVSQEEGYALVYGKGWHLMTQDFLADYTGTSLQLIGNDSSKTSINVPNVFIFHEKQIYETYKEMDVLAKAYDRRLKESQEVGAWIQENIDISDEMTLYYEDEYLAVYHLVQADAYDDIKERVIGPKA